MPLHLNLLHLHLLHLGHRPAAHAHLGLHLTELARYELAVNVLELAIGLDLDLRWNEHALHVTELGVEEAVLVAVVTGCLDPGAWGERLRHDRLVGN